MPSVRPTLSAIVITRNEARNLDDCLQSLRGLVDEIVVVDSQSTDDTVAIARRHGAVVAQPPDWPGFGVQKNRALNLATCDWVLSIDADERVTPELAQEIQAVLQQPQHPAYDVQRLSWYCGRFMRHGGWYPDPVLRLFQRGKGLFSDDLVHEKFLPGGSVGALRGHLLHHSFTDFSQVLDKVDRYSTASAQQRFAKGRRATIWGAIGHGLWTFVRTYVFKAGFLDGQHGLALAISNAEGSYYRYAKIWLLEQGARHEDQRHRRDV